MFGRKAKKQAAEAKRRMEEMQERMRTLQEEAIQRAERVMRQEEKERNEREKEAQEKLKASAEAALKESKEAALLLEQVAAEQLKELERRRGDVMERTETAQTRIAIEGTKMGMTERFEAHPAGTLMKYAVISNKPPPERELTLARLRTYKAKSEQSKLALEEVPHFDLSQDYTEMSLVSALSTRQLEELRNYVMVSDIFVHYIPLDTFYTEGHVVDFYINDFRRKSDTAVRHFPLTHSVGYNVVFSLDYCLRKEDLKHLTLSISTKLDSFTPGTAWGTVKVLLNIRSMDFPIKSNMQETAGVMHLADSDLKDFLSDPRSADGVLTLEGLQLLKAAYRRGEVENTTLPSDDRKEVNKAKTIMNTGDEPIMADSVMRFMKGQEGGQSSAYTPKKSSLKRPLPRPDSPRHPRPFSPTVEDAQDEDDALAPGDSISRVGSDITEEIARGSPSPPPRRTVNFGLG